MDKKIPAKNYIILAVVVLFTVISVFYARSWYLTTKEYENKNSVIKEVALEINQSEISNYTLENPKFILYVSSGQNQDIKPFESQMKKFIEKHELTGSMLYVNLDALEDRSKFENELKSLSANEKVKDQIKRSENVTIYGFDNGQITNVINEANDLTMTQLETLLQNYGMIDNE